MSQLTEYAANPAYLKHIRKYLSDPTEDVRIATENLLGDFLREIRDVTLVQRHHDEEMRAKREAEQAEQQARRGEADKDKLPDITMAHSERVSFIPENDDTSSFDNDSDAPIEEKEPEPDSRDLGSKLPILCLTTTG